MRDKQEKIIIAIISIGAIFVLCLATIDFGLIMEINQNKPYVYTSRAIGISMKPEIKNGDVLVILESDSPNFKTQIGDILVYRYDKNTLVAHRLYNEIPSGYFLKGDANQQAEFVPKELVVGKIIGVAPQNPIGRWSVQYVAEN